jgi:hypothetical protein
MSYHIGRSDKKILLIAAVFLAVLIVGGLLFLSPQRIDSSIPTSYSADSFGAKAAFLLLKETGYHVERWEQSPAGIQTFQNATLILAEPSRYANKEEQTALDEFIRQGGKLIAIGQSASFMLPVSDSSAAPLGEEIWARYPAAGLSPITHAAPQITIAPDAVWLSPSSAHVLYAKDKESAVVQYTYGKGSVIWWAAATPLTNAGLKEPGNLEFFLACLGDKEKTRILWDEYFHGYGDFAKSSDESDLFEYMLVQLGLAAAAIVLTFSRRSGPIRQSSQEIRLSPLEFVETLGGLYQHAHASVAAVDIHYQRFRYWLAKRLGISGNASIEEFDKAVRSSWNFHDERFVKLMKECSSVRYFPELPTGRALKLVRSLHSYAVKLKLFPASAKEKNPWKQSRNY